MRLIGFQVAAAVLACATPLSAHEAAAKVSGQARLPETARDAAAAVDAFHAALRRGDTSAAAALVADDALVFEEGGAERSKAEYAAQHLPADAEFSRGVSSTMTRRTGHADGSLAWIASEGRTKGVFKCKPIDRVTTETMILRRTDGGWKIVHIHWSSAAAR